MKHLNTLWLWAALTLVVVSSCKKKTEPPPEEVLYERGEGVFVGNEGLFQQGTASIFYYKFGDQTVHADVFSQANGIALGDICQSMRIIDSELYIVVNNSGKIEVVDPGNFEIVRTIQGFTSPRHIAKVGNNKAYVTNLFGNSIDVVNLDQGTITGSITLSGWSEELALAAGKVFVTNYNREYVYVIDPTSDAIEDSISVGVAGTGIQQDANGKLWVLCGGDTSTPASLHRIDPATLAVEQDFQFQDGGYLGKLRFNNSGTTMYILLGGIRKMNITAPSAPANAYIGQNGRSFYGLGVEPTTEDIYVADARDYTSNGVVLRYSSTGTLIDTFNVGVSPSSFLFY